MLIPETTAPALTIETVAHGRYDLAQTPPVAGTLVVFYRGQHCPICKKHLKELDDHTGDFAIRGIRILALSGDTHARAKQTVHEMQLIRLPVGYGLSMQAAHNDWGLFLSGARENTNEPSVFSEPGHFWIRQDGRISFSILHSLPFMRPDTSQILKAIDFTLSKNFPPRGSFAGTIP